MAEPPLTLVVEPHEDNLKLLELRLKRICPDYEIISASNGEAAIEQLRYLDLCKIKLYALIIARERLGMPAEQVIASARRNHPLLRVIAVTTDHRQETRNFLLENGADDILLKPYTIDELKNALKLV